MDIPFADRLFDVWHKLPYADRCEIATKYNLKRSGVISVVNGGNGTSQVQSDGFLQSDLEMFSKDYMVAICGPCEGDELLITKFFLYGRNNDAVSTRDERGAEEVARGAVSSSGESEGGTEGTSYSDVRTSERQATSSSGTGGASVGSNDSVLQAAIDERLDARGFKDGLRPSVQITEAERLMYSTNKYKGIRGEETSKRMKAYWANRKSNEAKHGTKNR
jgi:hypothetical protein